MTALLSPDCRDTNHGKCDQTAWDLSVDTVSPCQCPCHHPEHPPELVELAHLMANAKDGLHGYRRTGPNRNDFAAARVVVNYYEAKGIAL